MKLFSVAKVGLFLDTITHSTEPRQDQEVKIVTLALRVHPFDAKLAAAIAQPVRAALFNLNNPEPKTELRRVEFALGVPRQNLHIFAAPDAPTARLMLAQVRISGTFARTQKDVNGYAFCFKASFGPADRQELEFVQDWHLSQRFVTFDEAEPNMWDSADEDEGTEEDQKARLPAPMFETDADGKPTGDEREQRPLHSHADKKKRGGRRAEEPVEA